MLEPLCENSNSHIDFCTANLSPCILIIRIVSIPNSNLLSSIFVQLLYIYSQLSSKKYQCPFDFFQKDLASFLNMRNIRHRLQTNTINRPQLYARTQKKSSCVLTGNKLTNKTNCQLIQRGCLCTTKYHSSQAHAKKGCYSGSIPSPFMLSCPKRSFDTTVFECLKMFYKLASSHSMCIQDVYRGAMKKKCF